MFRYEMHLHSRACSQCARSDATEYIAAAKEHGYAGMVFTNHFFRGNTALDRTLAWKDFAGAYRDDYLRAKEVGDREGIDVLFGLEEGYGSGKEALIYGVAPEVIVAESAMPKMTISELAAFVRANGGFIAAAHPFRERSYIPLPVLPPDPKDFDALEVYNRGNEPEMNEKAVAFAKHTGLPGIAGGDVHSVAGFGTHGLAFPRRVPDNETLVRLLRAGDYQMIVDGKLIPRI